MRNCVHPPHGARGSAGPHARSNMLFYDTQARTIPRALVGPHWFGAHTPQSHQTGGMHARAAVVLSPLPSPPGPQRVLHHSKGVHRHSPWHGARLSVTLMDAQWTRIRGRASCVVRCSMYA
eukprot:5230868-Prymnesium_polylepis.2